MILLATQHLHKLIDTVQRSGAHSGVKYIGPKVVLKATQRKYKRGGYQRHRAEILVTFGPPNHRERAFIKACLKAKEPFPVKKIQLSGLPK